MKKFYIDLVHPLLVSRSFVDLEYSAFTSGTIENSVYNERIGGMTSGPRHIMGFIKPRFVLTGSVTGFLKHLHGSRCELDSNKIPPEKWGRVKPLITEKEPMRDHVLITMDDRGNYFVEGAVVLVREITEEGDQEQHAA